MGNFKHISRTGTQQSHWNMLAPKSADQSNAD